MWPFKKKKTYKIKWHLATDQNCIGMALVKAYNEAKAWKLIKKRHYASIILTEIIELRDINVR